MIRLPLLGSALLLCFAIVPLICEAQVFEETNLSPGYSIYGTPPYVFEGNSTISIAFTTTPEVLRELVPEPPAPNGDNLMSVVINALCVVQPDTLCYNEALLGIPVSYGESTGSYLPILYLDSAIAIVSGREIWGYSKIDADISIMEDQGKITAQVVRNGATLMDISLELGPEPIPLPVLPDGHYFNLKAIPSVACDRSYDVKQINSSVMRDYVIQKLIPGEAHIKFGPSPADPLGSIPVLSIQKAVFLEHNSILDHDGIVLDYLAEEE